MRVVPAFVNCKSCGISIQRLGYNQQYCSECGRKERNKRVKNKYYSDEAYRKNQIEKSAIRKKIKYHTDPSFRILHNNHMKKKRIEKAFGLSWSEYQFKIKDGCAICHFKEVVDLHHVNGRTDNQNLVCLCPNHHQVMHRTGCTLAELRSDLK